MGVLIIVSERLQLRISLRIVSERCSRNLKNFCRAITSKVRQLKPTDWLVEHELEAKVLPANRVPTAVVDVLYKPIHEMSAEAVTKLFAEAKAPVNWFVPDATIELETAARPLVE